MECLFSDVYLLKHVEYADLFMKVIRSYYSNIDYMVMEATK